MNKKMLSKVLVASALVLTTLGSGVHSSYLGLDTHKVVKTAKAEENMTENDIWKGIKSSLTFSNIINGNRYENIKVSYLDKNGQLIQFASTANHDSFTDTTSNFSKLTQIEIEKKTNIPHEDFNTIIDANNAWNKFTQKLKDAGLVKNGQKVTIQATNPKTSSTNSITGRVGETLNDKNADPLVKRFINKITIE